MNLSLHDFQNALKEPSCGDSRRLVIDDDGTIKDQAITSFSGFFVSTPSVEEIEKNKTIRTELTSIISKSYGEDIVPFAFPSEASSSATPLEANELREALRKAEYYSEIQKYRAASQNILCQNEERVILRKGVVTLQPLTSTMGMVLGISSAEEVAENQSIREDLETAIAKYYGAKAMAFACPRTEKKILSSALSLGELRNILKKAEAFEEIQRPKKIIDAFKKALKEFPRAPRLVLVKEQKTPAQENFSVQAVQESLIARTSTEEGENKTTITALHQHIVDLYGEDVAEFVFPQKNLEAIQQAGSPLSASLLGEIILKLKTVTEAIAAQHIPKKEINSASRRREILTILLEKAREDIATVASRSTATSHFVNTFERPTHSADPSHQDRITENVNYALKASSLRAVRKIDSTTNIGTENRAAWGAASILGVGIGAVLLPVSLPLAVVGASFVGHDILRTYQNAADVKAAQHIADAIAEKLNSLD